VSAPKALRAALIAAAREFNAGRYFEAHEALEESLDDVPEELWALFLGLIQISVGYHKLSQGLTNGAARMLGIGLEKVGPYPADTAGIDLRALCARARHDLDALRAGSGCEACLRPQPRLVLRKERRRR
jgi:predicted metal-dependent hydrolase